MTTSQPDMPPVGQRTLTQPQSDIRAALFALIGALVGGLATFGGAYWSGHQAQAANEVSTRRTAYISFLSAADQYENDLIQIRVNVKQHDKTSYAQIQRRLIAEVPVFYSDTSLIEFISTRTVGDDAVKALNSFFNVVTPPDMASLDMSALSKAISDGHDAVDKFKTDARNELNP